MLIPKISILRTANCLVASALPLFMIGCARSLPETFGLYVRFSGGYVGLDTSAAKGKLVSIEIPRGSMRGGDSLFRGDRPVHVESPKVPVFPDDFSLVLFYPNSGLPTAAETEAVKVAGIPYIRYLTVMAGWPMRKATAFEDAWPDGVELGSTRLDTNTVELQWKPTGRPEMLVGVPAKKLEPGLYVVTGGHLKEPYSFAVGDVQTARAQTCVDAEVVFPAIAIMFAQPSSKLSPCKPETQNPPDPQFLKQRHFPESATIEITSDRGRVIVKNFYKTLIDTEGGSILIHRNPEYEIWFSPDGSQFRAVVLTPVNQAYVNELMPIVSHALLSTLQVSGQDACRLKAKIAVGTSLETQIRFAGCMP